MATATNKNYMVYGRNVEELKTVKTLAAAKKLADAESGSVLVNGECVYRAAQPDQKAGEVQVEMEKVRSVAEQPIKKQKYTILSLMNIRSKPSMSAPIIGQVKPFRSTSAWKAANSAIHSVCFEWDNTQGMESTDMLFLQLIKSYFIHGLEQEKRKRENLLMTD